MKQQFQAQLRIKKSIDYSRLLRSGQKLKVRGMTLFYKPNHLDHARIGFVIAKKQIAKAVDRNAYRRLIKESFRKRELLKSKPLDIVVMLFKNIKEIDTAQIVTQLDLLWKKLETC